MTVPLEPTLQDRYRAWLLSPHPTRPERGMVAGKTSRRAMARGAVWERTCRPAWDQALACWAQTPEKVWVWSDHHLFHDRILELAGRPFAHVAEMNDVLLAQAQALVANDDWLLFLGDLSFAQTPKTQAWLAACPGRKALILGNHDRTLRGPGREPLVIGFEAVAETQDWPGHGRRTADGSALERLWFTHYPLGGRLPGAVLNVHGHTHQHTLPGPYANVSVEQTDHRPRRLLEVIARHTD